jgi:GH25 family lysozyme M1 (1,4-beta-N-acetylmuramidase)
MAKALGIDLSKYDYPVNLANATAEISFIIQRASYGITQDEKFLEVYNAIKGVRLKGAYHYFSTGISYKSQADKFLSIVNGKGFLFYVIDYETAYNTLSNATSLELKSMLEYLKPLVYPSKLLLYTSPSIYDTYLTPTGTWMNNWELWVAQYPYTASLDLTKGPKLPTGRTQWTFWQYGGGDISSSAGYSAGPSHGTGWHGCDLDQFNGDINQLNSWANITMTAEERMIRLDELNKIQEYINKRKVELG